MQRSKWCSGNEREVVCGGQSVGGKEKGRCGGWLGRHVCEGFNTSPGTLDLILRQQKMAQGFNQRRT